MKNQFINLHQYLSNILGTLNNINYEIQNNTITTYCVISLIVFLTLLGIVLYAEQSTNVTVNSLLDTHADLDRRTNDNSYPINMTFRQNIPGRGTAAFLYDINDRTGLRMARLITNRAQSFVTINGVVGIIYVNNPNYSTGVVNSQGNLLIRVNNYSLRIVDGVRPILTRGLPVDRQLHDREDVTILTILPNNNPNPN